MREMVGLAVLLAIACKSEPRTEETGPITVGVASGLSATGSGTAGDSEAAGSTGDKLDVGGNSGPGGMPTRCQKIDLLFIVDNSASMFDEQQNLLENFPEFFTEIEQLLDGDDVQVMVIDTDIGEGHACYEAMFNSFDCGLWCDANCPSGCNCECNAEPCSPWSAVPCDALIGAGRVSNASGTSCGLPTGQRYLSAADANAAQTFSCLADVGVTGEPNERPMQALLEAVGPLAEPSGCNDGFLRSDALLIVTILTDEDDSLASPGDPGDWHDAVVQAKHGQENNVVVLGLLGDPDLSGGLCPPFDPMGNAGAHPAPRLRAFVEMFPFGDWASVCEPSYASVFQDAIAAIDVACEEFVPPG